MLVLVNAFQQHYIEIWKNIFSNTQHVAYPVGYYFF